MNKSKVIETLDQLPEEFSTEELIDKLIFIEKVEQGINDVEEGKVISMDEAKERLSKKWQKYSSRIPHGMTLILSPTTLPSIQFVITNNSQQNFSKELNNSNHFLNRGQ
ncbi:MAG: hypothetical protein O2887_17480 [Bacteroidetes bacterium]|nr:hypothetical protein [Bacteroidota bacterium]MDA1122250.1 hypothetical protein [Bacteroidota bacterium]